MKKLLIGLGLVMFSYQASAITTVAGVDFEETATFSNSVGGYWNNTTDPVGNSSSPNPTSTTTGPVPIGDGNGASWVMSPDATATLDMSFTQLFDVSDVDITLLLIGNSYTHTGTITLMGGTSTFSDTFSLDSTIDKTKQYTGYNSVTASADPNADPDTFAIYALSIPLGGTGTFDAVQLSIGGLSATTSLAGVTSSAGAVIPVPAAVWLFGSGLLGLVGVARRRK